MHPTEADLWLGLSIDKQESHPQTITKGFCQNF